jgi:alpha-beta hydrolase superfamily lysophospholipase
VAPDLPLNMLSLSDPLGIARDLVYLIGQHIRHANKRGEKYDEIILIGHSIGGLLARQVYIIAYQEAEQRVANVSVENGDEPGGAWAEKVTRIVLLAGMNRGWSISEHMNLRRAILMKIGAAIGQIVLSVTGKRLLIFQVRRGAPFITQLRLDWIAMEARARQRGQQFAMTIQLLGSIDDLVSPDDNLDLVSGRNFIYLDVPESGHETVIEMDETKEGKARREVLVHALSESEDRLRSTTFTPADEGLPSARENISDVIFVIHGIRDTGYWTHKIARRVQEFGEGRSKPPKIYASETSTYGYFAMFPFLLPARRREKVEWLMDQFTEAKALYPNAKFSFVAHSNGTYLLAKALSDYPSCKFEHVVFAGSVVRRKYDWKLMLKQGKVKAVLNYVATTDWVVAWFPGAVEMVRLQDLGSAGHNGFNQIKSEDSGTNQQLYQRRYVPGGHGAAIQENMWSDIAYFILHGAPPARGTPALARHRSWWVVLGGWMAPVIWLAIFCILGGMSLLIWRIHIAEWQRTLTLIGSWWLVWKIVTRI